MTNGWLGRAATLGQGALAAASAGAVWAALCVVLAANGHAPSVVLLPIDRERYYLAQAAFVIPLLLCLWLVCSAIAFRLARALGGKGAWADTAGRLGFALAIPLVGLFLAADIIALAAGGFESLGAVVRVTAPLTFAMTLALATRAVRASHGLPRGRAFVAGAAGVLAQALVGGPFLR